MATPMKALPANAPIDPDAQATVNDFLDYTEYLPSDLIRSLTLIRKLDETYLTSTDRIHELTQAYGELPKIASPHGLSLQDIRYQISHHIDDALNAREASFAEASRAYDEVDRHFNRLTNIITKLHALPKPPSRDPTPVPVSPQASRARQGRRSETRNTPPPRITLRLDNARAAVGSARTPGAIHLARKNRNRKITVPGEVLPPPNPDSPPPMTESDWESVPPSPLPMPTSRVGAPSRSRSKPGRLKVPKPPRPPMIRAPKATKLSRPPRPPGAMGTNVHSAVAGISTSNALSLLSPPPSDAKPGTPHAPWMRLTEWEMAKLRKRMKKNAIWSPSETMIRRELSEAGRGPENYRIAKANADASGENFIDEDNIATTAPGKTLAPGEISADSLGLGETKLSNRGMKLNEAKKLKRQMVAQELAAQEASARTTAEMDAVGSRLAGLGSAFKNLFTKKENIPVPMSPLEREKKPKPTLKLTNKRKRDTATPTKPEDNLSPTILTPITVTKPASGPAKRQKLAPIKTTTTTSTIPLANPSVHQKTMNNNRSKANTPAPLNPLSPTTPRITNTRSRRPSLTIRGPLPPSPPGPSTSRPGSRHHSEAPSRRTNKSATPRPQTPVLATAASRRSKRPAPGPVTSSQDGGAAVSVGRRKNAPRNRGGLNTTETTTAKGDLQKQGEQEQVEEIDPDEPRYCLCGDVSWGEMVACENDDCEGGEWFHFQCVGLQEKPGRRTKWYCPVCTAKLGK